MKKPRSNTTRRGEKIQHSKRRGEWAEMCFQGRAAEYGLEVSKPWGESASYDFIVEKSRQMARVQVKSTISRTNGGYICQLRDSHGTPYQGDPFDFIAVYLIPEDIWYIIPAKALRGRSCVGLYPRLKRSKYDKFHEAWHLLPGKPAASGKIDCIQACAEDWPKPPGPDAGSQEENLQTML